MRGLVLGGGGVKGSYQIGAYLAFKKCNMKIDGVVGTSIGSFNAAMLACGKDQELYKFWKNVDVGYLLGLNKNYVDSVNDKNLFKEFIYGLIQAKDILKSKGISSKKIKTALDIMINEKELRNSSMDFGLVTVKISKKTGFKPLYMFKEDMEEGKITEYILASCNLPVFKLEKMIDDSYYIDGGFYDTTPVKMLQEKGYDEIYVINLHGVGIYQKINYQDNSVTVINPSKFLGSTLNVNKKQINDNIKLGYYDTLKVLKKLDGYNYIFKKKPLWYYNMRVKKIDKDLLLRVKKYFRAKDNKELVLKALEYVMLKEDLTYFDIYKINLICRYAREYTTSKHFVYEFVRRL